jgi:SAM-dependent methyltransferase
MRIKPDWLPVLHAARTREIETIFGRVPPLAFTKMLELGAGDGFQSRLLSRYGQSLISTELNPNLLPPDRPSGIDYRVMDAEAVGDAFPPGEFDLIFSSNLLEHLPDVGRAIRGMHRVLKDDGLGVHIMPSPLWKVSHLACFPVELVVSNLDALLVPERRRRRLQQLRHLLSRNGSTPPETPPDSDLGNNNLKVRRDRGGRLRRRLVPEPHGVSRTHLEEFRAFSPVRWEREFTDAGFAVVARVKGPVTSGYGFGLDRLRRLVERVGLTTEYVYVVAKRGQQSRYADWFR